MRNAKGLQIGNFVRNKEGVLLQMDSISNGQCTARYNNHFTSCMIEELTPIPLTPDVLDACGFIRNSPGLFGLNFHTHYLSLDIMPDGVYPTYVQVPEMSHQDEQRVSLNKIKYLHQLQNLTYCLTGEELKEIA